ncbi:MAG: diaminopimelate epimerase [Elusimicrobia bacterium]|nr:diaminopimelate epimerase [Elusimicrobiota bacterium]
MRLRFWKLSGAGNDFILAEEPSLGRVSRPVLARRLCGRRTSIGADGLLLIRLRQTPPRLEYFNADGSRAFCGNGARCAFGWMFALGLAGRKAALMTDSGAVEGEIAAWEKGALRGRVRTTMPLVRVLSRSLRLKAGGRVFELALFDSGVPHAVARVGALEDFDVPRFGRLLRRHPAFRPAGANVDFIRIGPDCVGLRTYERGVEDETLACGTGAAAAAAAAHLWAGLRSPARILTRSGALLRASFQPGAEGYAVRLEGPAEITFKGEVSL